jgi:1,4-alpha-glucan branching enzyme
MQPQPTDHPGLLRVPAPSAQSLAIRLAPLADRDHFNPLLWRSFPMPASAMFAGWWEIDLDTLGLADGLYEYEFTKDGEPGTAYADPYAQEITRFGGYRGLFTIAEGKRAAAAFRWDDEFPEGRTLPNNNRIVIYEMPIRWMASNPAENPLVDLGTFDKTIFEHLNDLAQIGVNCIELLPIEDTTQTLNWGYGTRFYFAPDYDLGNGADARFFIKRCHQLGIRVFLDVVMAFCDKACPVMELAPEWFRAPSANGRKEWGGDLFLFNSPAYGSYFAAKEFLCQMGEFWVDEYHIDGFRIDDFPDIANWDFVREFRDRATAASSAAFPGKPFWVIAEDTNRDWQITGPNRAMPNGRKVADALWNFGYRDEIRRLVTDSIATVYGQPSRTVRVEHLISKDGVWNGSPHFDPGYADLACSVDYATSHDVADAPRLMNVILGAMIGAGMNDAGIAAVKAAIDNQTTNGLRAAVDAACRRVFGAFAILLTSVGIPMLLAGEEFGDVHDQSNVNANLKQQDPVQWLRAALPANAALRANVGALIGLRASHPALERNEVSFFYFNPRFDDNAAPRVFAYCRTAGLALGSAGQAIVIANMGPAAYAIYHIPGWPWQGMGLTEYGYAAPAPTWNAAEKTLSLRLDAFAARVFTT